MKIEESRREREYYKFRTTRKALRFRRAARGSAKALVNYSLGCLSSIERKLSRPLATII